MAKATQDGKVIEKMQVITTVQEMLNARASWANTRTIGLVPTMGYLHRGHLSLVRQARDENSLLAVSIFVNPTQFGPHEDLDNYPRDLSRDLCLLKESGVDVVFTPDATDMYPPDFITFVDPGGPRATAAEGAHRPGHFRGVATVVLKLLQLIQPQQVYFGQKDAQQVSVISRMVTDLHLPVTMRVLSTLREADGLAMSSRNAYLNPAARASSTILYQALLAGQRAYENRSTHSVADVIRSMQEVVASDPQVRLGYAEVRDPRTFLPRVELLAPALLLIAASLGTTRLIDNFLLREDGTWDTGMFAGQE